MDEAWRALLFLEKIYPNEVMELGEGILRSVFVVPLFVLFFFCACFCAFCRCNFFLKCDVRQYHTKERLVSHVSANVHVSGGLVSRSMQ